VGDGGGWTFGAELEWPDVDVRAELPAGWGWSRTDYTVVGSDGIANDPLHRTWFRSGELNTPVCRSPEELAERTLEVREALRPGHNYRSNLHVHIGGGPEFSDLEALKSIAGYSRRLLPGALKMMDPLNGLFEGLTDPEEIEGAKLRAAHSERSRHFFISDERHAARMTAEGLESMLQAEVPKRRADGMPQWHLATREAVNLRSLRKHGTIEFRCFAGDSSAENVWAAACFVRDWVTAALSEAEAFELPYFYSLPVQAPFRLELERGWEWTNYQHNRRGVVEERLREMGAL
jgi:hypothetical protein